MARSFAVSTLAVIGLFIAQAQAQTEPIWSNVTCTDQLWSLNSAGWTPCLVSAHLSAQCTTDNSWGVPAIGTEGPYSPPNGTYANRCRCNSVQWNLLSACSMCQGGQAGTWQRWTVNCSSTVTTSASEGGYPLLIPSGVSVPHWAYYDFTLSGIFNAVIASQQTGPESSAVSSSTPTGTRTSSTSATAVATSTNVPSGSDDAKSSGSNTGAIVGGVVGGVVGIALIAVIAFIVVRKNKQNQNKGAESHYEQSQYNPQTGPQPGSGIPMMGQYQSVGQHTGVSPVAGSAYKPYDPSDPSTFPNNYNAPSHYAESIPYSHQTPARPGQYNGAPEI
ncbi:unnamed protein product [Rhizoctonia solani]|uniref:Transmembrane protein n=1 Tax=Rhizoctonia solani TaxID=456999 RepID=A0A8H2XFI6_9AGAM|nr:unnamed protein product [Rhizoctonia solani]